MDKLENICCVPGAAGGHAQRLLVAGLPEAADRQDDGHQHQRHGRRQHHVQPQVEVGALRQPAHLNIGRVRLQDPQDMMTRDIMNNCVFCIPLHYTRPQCGSTDGEAAWPRDSEIY